MEKEIKDYLHLYKDCIVQVKRKNDCDYNTGRVCEITSSSNHGDWIEVWFDDVITVTGRTIETSSSNCHNFFFSEDHIKPILRPLNDMTEEEKDELEELQYDDNIVTLEKFGTIVQNYVPEIFRRMLEMKFDLFGLIEEKLAIDKTALKS